MQLISLEVAKRKLGGVSLSLLRKAIADGRLQAVRVWRRVFLDAEYLEDRLRVGQLFCPSPERKTFNRKERK